MRANEFITESSEITESLSRVVYHYTNINAAAKILSSGEFQLSSVLGSIEEQYAPKGYPYFFSTTRTKTGGYHEYVGASAVMFVLEGNYYNQKYPSKPVDYWGNRDPESAYGRKHEAEDRLFSKDPTIPIGGVTSVHVLIKKDADPHIKAYGRNVLLAAKKRGIPASYYNDEAAWRNLDTTKTASVGELKGQQATNRSHRRHRGYLMPWLEVMQATDDSKLSSKGRDIVRSIRRSAENVKIGYMRDRDDIVKGLANEMSNARKPNSGEDRNNAIKIINYMRTKKLQTLTNLVDDLTAKWTKEPVSETVIKLGGFGPSEKTREWVHKVKSMFYNQDQNSYIFWNHEGNIIPLGKEETKDIAAYVQFELVPKGGNKVEVKWIQATPLRGGYGSKGMKILQDLAQQDGIALTLFPWDKGVVSQSKLIKFYKKQGFNPLNKSKNMIWEPKTDGS